MVVLFFTGQVLCKHTWLFETGHGSSFFHRPGAMQAYLAI